MGEQLHRCVVCKEYKPLDHFWKDKSRSSGLDARCKDCSVERWRREVYPKVKSRDSYRSHHRKRQQRYLQSRPEVAIAHQKARANRSEIKKSKCEQCGETNNLHMHHPDYSQPLKVLTLCVPCHEAVHHRG